MNGIEFRRRALRLTQAQLAERVGIHHQTRISEYERGLRPSPAHLMALAGFFGMARASAESLLADVPVPHHDDLRDAIVDKAR